MDGITVHVDFRQFTEFIRRTQRATIRLLDNDELRESIYLDIANSDLLWELKDKDTGATHVSLETVKHGGDVYNEPHQNSKGVIRFASASIGPKGIWINPTDAYDRPYGEYTIGNKTSEYNIKYDMDRNGNLTTYNKILAIVEKELKI